ncbi:MAG: hypothetical protein N2319_09675, partial [Candidatus Kapabacteria bacterium]|nr:hypothetical protein [Candidatus Kapabacteria bacterium]
MTLHNSLVIPLHTGISYILEASCLRRRDISLGKEPPQDQRSRHLHHSLLDNKSKKILIKINLDIRIIFIIKTLVRCESFPNTEHRTPNTEHRTPNTEHRTPN